MTAPHSISSGYSGLRQRAENCAKYDFDTVEMIECKWALWDEILVALRTPALPSGEVEDHCIEGRENLLLIAHEIRDARNAYIDGMGQTGNASRKEKLSNVLHDDATTIADALEAYASSHTPQIAGDVWEVLLLAEDTLKAVQRAYNCPDSPIINLTLESIAAAISPQAPIPPFSRWADTIEAASLTISPKGSKELDALAAEIRDYDKP